MKDLNITEYKNRGKEFHMYHGKISIKKGFYVTNYDASFYCLVGKKIYISLPEQMHPDDVDSFYDAVKKLDEGPQHILFRILCDADSDNERYRVLYAILNYNGKIIEGEKSFDMELLEIMAITEQFKLYRSLVDKYREFMSMSTYIFMEYEYASDTLKLYRYSRRQNRPICSCILEEQFKKVTEDDELDFKQKSEFETLYSILRRGQDHAVAQFDFACFTKEQAGIRGEMKVGIIYEDSSKSQAVGIVNIVSEKTLKKSYYLSDSAYDPGTGLLNKRAVTEYAMEKIQNKAKGLCVVIIDLDDFKKVNDTFGHMRGDEVLSKVAEIMKGVVKNKGIVGRFGGDEFMVILEGMTKQMDMRVILSTISKKVIWAFDDPNGPKVTLSIGAAMYPVDGETYEELFQKADKCVYIAKAKGKNRFIMYEEEKHGSLVIENGIRSNIGLKSAYSDDKKNDVVSDLTMQLYNEGKEALIPVMKDVQAYFDIEGITIYAGERLERKLSIGKYINPIESLDFIKDEEYQEMFNEQGFYEENRIERLEKKAPKAFKAYTEQENGKFIQCEAKRDGVPAAVVSFDFFNRSPKHGTMDLGLMKIVGRQLAEVAARSL